MEIAAPDGTGKRPHCTMVPFSVVARSRPATRLIEANGRREHSVARREGTCPSFSGISRDQAHRAVCLVQASLRMDVLDGASNLFYDFRATYSLAKFAGAWRIVAIAHNQIPWLL